MGTVKILRASAGSGKTYRLAYEYVRAVVLEPWCYRHILAVTFTNKATDEMKRRILTELNDLAYGRPTSFMKDLVAETKMMPEAITSRAREARTNILHDYSHFAVSTIDAFFQRIIRAFLKELSLDSDFVLELQTDSILSQSIDYLLDDSTKDPKLKNWIEKYIDERMDDGKRWKIKEELMKIGHEIFKEIFLVAHADETPDAREKMEKAYAEIIKIATTAKLGMQNTANEAIAIIEQNGLSVDDFPYKIAGFAGSFFKISRGIFEEYGSRVTDALADIQKWAGKTSAKRDEIIYAAEKLHPLLERLCHEWDENAVHIRTADVIRENFRAFMLLEDISQRIRRVGREQNLVMMHETSEALARLIEGNDAPFIYEKVGNTYSRFMIDEFQDTSDGQWKRFLPLLENAVATSEETPVLVVGDVKQSIYRWRGGDWRILGSHVAEAFRNVDEQTLDTNWRSSANIIKFNNTLIRNVVAIDNYELNAMTEDSQAPELSDMLGHAYRDAEQKLPSGRAENEGYVRVTVHNRDEEPSVIETVAELMARGFRQKDIAVLVRKNSQTTTIAGELISGGYNIMSQEALLLESSDAVQFIIAVMRLSKSLTDSIMQAIYNRFLGRAVAEALPEEDLLFLASLPRMPLDECIEQIINHFDMGHRANDIPYIQGLHDVIVRYCSRSIADVDLFLKWWGDNSARQRLYLPNEQDAITVITIHKAKGLQYGAVIIPYCDWSLVPDNRSYIWAETGVEPFKAMNPMLLNYKKAIEGTVYSPDYLRETLFSHIENINLLYVAVTRAERELHIMMPEQSQPKGRTSQAPKNVAQLISSCIGLTKGIENEGDGVYTFGQAAMVEPKVEVENESIKLNDYVSHAPDNRLRIKWLSNKYTDISQSPRRYGIVMHKLFETIKSIDEVGDALSQMVVNGEISAGDQIRIREMVEVAMRNPVVADWFDGRWVVRNEHQIIIPRYKGVLRPDRVLTLGNQAIVIDYKFGENEISSHLKQVDRYASTIRSMGYTDVKGYVWYVEMNKVVEVIGLN